MNEDIISHEMFYHSGISLIIILIIILYTLITFFDTLISKTSKLFYSEAAE